MTYRKIGMEYKCVFCGKVLESPVDLEGQEVECPYCGRDKLVPLSKHRKKGCAKNIVAVIIGMILGLCLRIIIGIPLFFIFATEDGMPSDITLILEVFVAFVAGAMAGSLVLRMGWLAGMLTQLLRIIVTILVIGLLIFVMVTDKEVSYSFNLLRSPDLRVVIISVIVACVAGTIGQKYRKEIWGFLGHLFGLIAGIFMFVLYGVGSLAYLYFLYRGGKALFEEGAILKSLFWILIAGPLISYGGIALVMGIGMIFMWVFKKIHDWYAPDLGFSSLNW